jgi:hypothetical protein
VRPDKNKAAAPAEALLLTLAGLERDLALLTVFLAAYTRSNHPQRFEALRWQLPILQGRLAAIRALER